MASVQSLNRSKSTANTDRRPSRRSSAGTAFLKRFEEPDDYGKALRGIESKSYKLRKEEKAFSGNVQAVGKEDQRQAGKRGVEQAELELALRTMGDNSEQRVRDCHNEKTVRLSSQERAQHTGRRSSFYDLHKDQAKKHRPVVEVVESEDDPADTDIQSTAKPSSKRKQSADQSYPAKNTSGVRPTGYRQPRNSQGEIIPLHPGYPSAPNRGTIHFVANPEFIPDTNNRRNLFFETMPGPEVWHRRMPPYFPFGETPFMEREMSRQINEDLARGEHRRDSLL